MHAAHAQGLPDGDIAAADWRFFRTLAEQAAEGGPVEQVLAQLAAHLNVSRIVLVRPDERPPALRQVVVAPLQWGDTRLGDVYADVSAPPDHVADHINIAAQLAFFLPVLVLRVAIDLSLE